MANAINIIIDDDNPHHTLFVEIEDDDGKSIRIGERVKYASYTKIRITKEDIEKLNCKGDWARHIKETDKFL